MTHAEENCAHKIHSRVSCCSSFAFVLLLAEMPSVASTHYLNVCSHARCTAKPDASDLSQENTEHERVLHSVKVGIKYHQNMDNSLCWFYDTYVCKTHAVCLPSDETCAASACVASSRTRFQPKSVPSLGQCELSSLSFYSGQVHDSRGSENFILDSGLVPRCCLPTYQTQLQSTFCKTS